MAASTNGTVGPGAGLQMEVQQIFGELEIKYYRSIRDCIWGPFSPVF